MHNIFSVYDIEEEYKGLPLLITGAGPSWDTFDFSNLPKNLNIFCLNHTITELYKEPKVWWVSNDHDRTWGSDYLRKTVVPRVEPYSPWKTITQKKFIPGDAGNFKWIDHKGKKQDPMEWRLPLPEGSTVAYYVGSVFMKEHPDWIRNGHTVLELALEVATLWQFSPIVLVGCDQHFDEDKNYYAKAFRWKDTPRRILHGKIKVMAQSIEANRTRWPEKIYSVTTWKEGPFQVVSPEHGRAILNSSCSSCGVST